MKERMPPPDQLIVDELSFELRWSRRRRTIGITVERDGRLRVAAPAGSRTRRVEAAVRAKLPWVRRKLAEFAAMGPPKPLLLVEGGRLPYLGRSFRIAVVDDPGEPVGLRHGRFELARGLDSDTRAAVVAWYTTHAAALIRKRVDELAPLLEVTPRELVVRDIGRRRWGFCEVRRGRVSFHWEAAMLAPNLVDYLVVHELAHLREPHHGPAFWREVERVLPDWRERRRRLAAGSPRELR